MTVASEQGLNPNQKTLVQIRVIGLHRVTEETVRSKIKAREWTPYSEQDRALDTAALLATGEFVSVKTREIDVSSAAFRLDIELEEASPVAPISVSSETTWVGISTPPAAPAAAPVPPPQPAWTPRPYVRSAPAAEPGSLAPPWYIGDIVVKGNRHATYNVIRSQLKARKGDMYDRPDLDHDIQALVSMGNFERVTADLSPMPDKPVPERLLDQAGSTTAARLTLLVEEKPILRKIRFEGNKKISKSKLADTVTLKEKDPLDRLKMKEDADKIQQLYLDKGYLGAKIDPRISIDTNTSMADLVFSITEGPRTLVGSVRIIGAQAFKPKKVWKQMENRPKKTFQESKLEDDKKKIETLYKNHGYSDFQITDSTYAFSADKSSVAITFTLQEGRQYRFGKTEFSGNTVFTSTELVKALEYRRGKIFDQEKFDASIKNLQQDYYAEKGYLRARVSPTKTYNSETKQMDVDFDVTEGNIVYVDHVDVEGNHATKTYVLKREIVVKPGQIFQVSRIKKSEEKLQNLGFIDDVQLDPEPSASDPDKVDLTFDVTEGKPGMMTAGAGFSSLDGLIGTLSLQHMNLFGRAQRASISWQFGKRVQDYSLSWSTPWLGDHPTSLGLSGFNTMRLTPYQSSLNGYTTRRTGGSVNLGPRFEDDKYQLSFTYTFQVIGVNNIQDQFASILTPSTSISSSIGAEFARDTRDNIWDPSSGSRNAIGMTLAGGPFYGDLDYWKPYISNAKHFTLATMGDWPLVLTFANRGAYITPFSTNKMVPIFETFFLGGQDTMRGYEPTGEVGFPGGGKVYDVYTNELGFPLAREHHKSIVKLVGFFDAGSAWDNMRSVRTRIGTGEEDVKADVGIGIRFVTPAFPIRLDWGYGLEHRSGEKRYVVNFGIGSLF